MQAPTRFPPDLVAAARDGDAAALQRLVGIALPVVVGWCARLGGTRIDAEDAAHEVMLVVLGKIGSVRDSERFGAWLWQVTRKVLASHRRRAWFARWIPGLMPEHADAGPGPLDRVAASETSRRVRDILEVLPEAQREVFVLCDIEGRTDAEVAALLEAPAGTVKSRLRLARERFRALALERGLAPDLAAVEGGI